MITRKFLRSLSFKPFSEFDYQGFAGVESPVPLIAETDEYLIILDGNRCEVYGHSGEPEFVCYDVCGLPYEQ